MLAGNHDYYGNVSAQLGYAQLNERWVFPDYYYAQSYNFSTPAGIKTLDLVVIDTVTALIGCMLVPDVMLEQCCMLCVVTSHTYVQVILAGLTEAESEDDVPTGPISEPSAAQEWKWIEQQLAVRCYCDVGL